MIKIRRSLFIITFVILFPTFAVYAQDADIVPYLKQIENGSKQEVAGKLPELKKNYPNSPSILFLEGVLTENGQQALAIYSSLIKKYPNSKYADAAVYRVYTYYYAMGRYKTSKTYLDKLKKEYPNSPYIKLAERYLPDKDFDIAGGSNKLRVSSEGGNRVTSGKDTLTSAKTSAETDSEKYKFTIQAGAFTVDENAKSLKKEFDNAGYYSTNGEKMVAGTLFHIVYVGKFVNQGDAKNFLATLNTKFNLNGRVVSLSSK
jgi:tetratricopeptide (TPR) repeat protein